MGGYHVRIVFGLFLAAHGFVHLLYIGQALEKFEITPGLQWPDGAWALSWLSASAVRWIATIALGLVGLTFMAASIALAFRAGTWEPLALAGAAASSLSLMLLWNGRMESLDAQGLIAILLNAAIVVTVLGFHWPNLE